MKQVCGKFFQISQLDIKEIWTVSAQISNNPNNVHDIAIYSLWSGKKLFYTINNKKQILFIVLEKDWITLLSLSIENIITKQRIIGRSD